MPWASPAASRSLSMAETNTSCCSSYFRGGARLDAWSTISCRAVSLAFISSTSAAARASYCKSLSWLSMNVSTALVCMSPTVPTYSAWRRWEATTLCSTAAPSRSAAPSFSCARPASRSAAGPGASLSSKPTSPRNVCNVRAAIAPTPAASKKARVAVAAYTSTLTGNERFLIQCVMRRPTPGGPSHSSSRTSPEPKPATEIVAISGSRLHHWLHPSPVPNLGTDGLSLYL